MNSDPDPMSLPDARIRALRLVHLALMGGVVLFGVVAFVVARSNPVDPSVSQPDLTLTWIAAAVIAITVPSAFGIRASRFARCGEIEDEDRAFAAFAAGSLVFGALLESSALAAIVLTFAQGSFTPTGWLALLPLLAMAIGTPSEDQFAGLRRLR